MKNNIKKSGIKKKKKKSGIVFIWKISSMPALIEDTWVIIAASTFIL